MKELPLIDKRTYLAGSLASMTVFTALHMMFDGFGNGDFFTILLSSFLSGPAWAHFMLFWYCIRKEYSCKISLTYKEFFLGLFAALWMPLGVVDGLPVPFWAFAVREFMTPNISWSLLGVMYIVWVCIMTVILVPAKKSFQQRGIDVYPGYLFICASFAFGLFPSLSLFFMDVL